MPFPGVRRSAYALESCWAEAPLRKSSPNDTTTSAPERSTVGSARTPVNASQTSNTSEEDTASTSTCTKLLKLWRSLEITALNEGLKTLPVTKTNCLPAVTEASTACLRSASMVAQSVSAPPLTGWRKRAESYKESTLACARPLVPRLKRPSSPGSTLMGRPSRVFTNTEAKS